MVELRRHPVVQDRVDRTVARLLELRVEDAEPIRHVEGEPQVANASERPRDIELTTVARRKTAHGLDRHVGTEARYDLEVLVSGGAPIVFADDDGVFRQLPEPLEAIVELAFVPGDGGDNRVVTHQKEARNGQGRHHDSRLTDDPAPSLQNEETNGVEAYARERDQGQERRHVEHIPVGYLVGQHRQAGGCEEDQQEGTEQAGLVFRPRKEPIHDSWAA